MQGIIAPRVKTLAIHSAVQLGSTALWEALNLGTVLEGHLLKVHNHLSASNVLRASTVYQNLLPQVNDNNLILSNNDIDVLIFRLH